MVDADFLELRGDLREEEAARGRKKAISEKGRVVLVAGHEERRSRSRPRRPVAAPRRKPREEELEEAWIADEEREAELRDRERDLARRERIFVESLRKERRQREAIRSPPRTSPSARRRRSPSGKGGEGDGGRVQVALDRRRTELTPPREEPQSEEEQGREP